MQVNSSASAISLPKGGGALHGLGEKFAPDLHTGTGNFSIPIALPPGRGGFEPQLSLVYSTGNGNGPFGLGWNLSVPNVTRKTSHGVPRYNEHLPASDPQIDVFLLSGSEDLVKVSGDYPGRVRYRPRTEGLFGRIEHVRDESGNYWEARTKDGVMSRYGARRPAGAPATENDPAITIDTGTENSDRIFCWKLTETRDPFGNLIVYEYLRDSGARQGRRWDQPLLKRIKYADYGDPADPSFLVQVEFVYEPRPDAFSEYRSGFDIRTTLRCQKILVRTHTADGVVHQVYEYHLLYEQDPNNGVSLLRGVELFGFDDAGVITEKPAIPPLTYGYSRFAPEKRRFKTVEAQALPLQSISGPSMELVDLHGNGLPDLVEMNGAVRYWRNLGDGRFDWPQMMENAPPHRLGDPGVQFIDADGDGRADLLATTAPFGGYYPMSVSAGWDRKSFQAYAQAPTVSFEDPEVKLLDLDGDGVTDVLRSGARFECFFNDSDPQRAWRRTAFVERRDLDNFPNVNFSDPRIRLADMTGDGLQDIVAIHDGCLEYWPNLGHGRWGARIRMRRSPRFPYGYNPQRILLGDVDGDGLADLVYVDHGRVLLWINQSGNAWSADPIVISGTPPMTNAFSVRLIDLEGTGVSGLLWSRDANGSSRGHLQFLDFTGGIKPYLLNRMDNNLGAETRVEYRPSTRDYLRDHRNPKTRWQTPLPFPVQVVAKVELIDHLSRGKLTTEYRYHHGYWDGAEREFRGFGMVEQLDTESFEVYNSPGLHGTDMAFDDFNSPNRRQQFSPPTLTKTWFHQGPVGDEFGEWREPDYSREFWPGDPPALSRPKELKVWLDRLPRRAKRDALRSLRGQVLRTELYAVDGTDREDRPYTVTESLFGVREEAPPGPGEQSRRRIFFPFALAQRTTQWERGDEPMTQLSFIGDYDAYGQPRKRLSVAAPRGRNYRLESGAGEPYLAVFSETLYAQRDDAERFIVDRTARSASYEVINNGQETPFQLWEKIQSGSATLGLIGLSVQYYDGAAFEGLPFQQLGDYGAPMRTESLVATEEILREAYKAGPDDAHPSASDLPPYLNPNGPTVWTDEYPAEFQAQLPSLAGYVYHLAGQGTPYATGYYVTVDRRKYDFHESGRRARGLVSVARDPLGRDASVKYDAHDHLPVEAVDPVGLKITASYNYRVLQPESVIDQNGNTSRATFTPLGLVNATYLQGKAGEGDQDHPSVRLEYDLLAFIERGQPAWVRAIRRIHHDSETDVPEPQRLETIESVEFSDGFGRLLQTRGQAEDVLFGDAAFGAGGLPVDPSSPPGRATGRMRQPGDAPNVVVSGRQVYDNKGRVVESYEPYFSTGWSYQPPGDAEPGQKALMFYDSRGQIIRTVNPDGSEQRVIYGAPTNLNNPEVFKPTPWEAYTYDANDNAGRTHATSAAGFKHHWNTPSNIVIDALGRTVLAVSRNRSDPAQPDAPIEEIRLSSSYDIRGNPLTMTDALGRVAFKYTYNLANVPLRIDSIDAGVRRIVLDVIGKEIERRDSKGSLILQEYDDLSRPTRMWARDERNAAVTLRQVIEYGDGGNSNQDAAERESQRQANRLGLAHRHYDEAGRTTINGYDFKGNTLDKTREVISDAELMTVFAASNPSAGYQIDWSPRAGQGLEERAAALLDSRAYQTSYSFDALNRVKTLVYPLDQDGLRKTMRPHYNRAGALERVTLDDRVYVEHIAYNAKGQRTLIAMGAGVMTRYAYDAQTFRLRRLRSERYTRPDPISFQPAGGLLQDFNYEYDLAGNILKITDRIPGCGVLNNPQAPLDPALEAMIAAGDALVRRFEYDAIYRLTSATGRESKTLSRTTPWYDDTARAGFNAPNHGTPNQANAPNLTTIYKESYAYDAAGNITRWRHDGGDSAFVRQFSLVQGNNRLLKLTIGQSDFAYYNDANGNMTGETASRHFNWNHSDQMKSFRTQVGAAAPSIHALYLYDAGGVRVKKLVRKQNGQLETSVYVDSIFEHHRWQGGENNYLHVMDDQRRIALVRVGTAHPDDRGPATQYHLGDHLGSSGVVIDQSGGFINREEYLPYGEVSFGGFAKKRYRFTGMERDEESGMGYHTARYYAAWLARFTAVDPEADSFAQYSPFCYGSDNPMKFSDESGHQPDDKNPSRNWVRTLETYEGSVTDFEKKAKQSDYLLDQATHMDEFSSREGITELNEKIGSVRQRADTLIKRGNALLDKLRTEENIHRGWVISPDLQDKISRIEKLKMRFSNAEKELSSLLSISGSGGGAGGGSGKKGGGGPVERAPTSRRLLGAVVTAAFVAPAALKAVEQFRSGDYSGGLETTTWTILDLFPTTRPLVCSKAVSDTFEDNREGIMSRATDFGEFFDPGTPYGVRTVEGGVMAAAYAVGESVARTAGEPVRDLGLAIGAGYARAIEERYPGIAKPGQYYEYPVNPGMGHR
jgi:RHS repeat-associated protein